MGLIATALTIWQGVRWFQPHLSVEPGVTLDAKDPVETRFVLTNIGEFPVRNVAYSCNVWHLAGQVEYPPGVAYVAAGLDVFPRLEPGGRYSMRCSFANSVPLDQRNWSSAEMTVAVRFLPAFIDKPNERLFRFVLVRSSDQTVSWLPRGATSDPKALWKWGG